MLTGGADRGLALPGYIVELRCLRETLTSAIFFIVSVIGLTLSHTGLVVEDIKLLLGAVASQVGTLLELTIPLEPSIADLIHALELSVVVDGYFRRTGLALLEGLVPHWSLLRANFASHLRLVPNRLHVVTRLGSFLLALVSHIVKLSSVGTDHFALQSRVVPGSALSADRLLALLSGRVIVFSSWTSHRTHLRSLVPSCVDRASFTLAGSLVVDGGCGRAEFAGLGGVVPNGFVKGTDAVSGMEGLGVALVGSCVIDLRVVARRIASVGSYVVGEVV